MKTVCVLGWYGHRNFGDDLILMGLRNLFKGWRVVPMTCDNRGVYPKLDLAVVNDGDLFVLGGGELVQKNFLFMPAPTSLKYRSLAYRLHARSIGRLPWLHRIKVPKVILGCGVNVESRSELSWNVVRDLKRFDYIGLRDNVAVGILRSIPQFKSKIHLFHDLAFAVNTHGSCRKQSEDTAVVIPTDRFSNSDRGVRECNIAVKSHDWLKERLRKYKKAVFIAFGGRDNDDFATCESLSSCSSNSQIFRSSQLTVGEILALIGASAIVYPYRLHGLILAFMAGVRYEFYPYHWKLQRVHDTIKDSSLEAIRGRQHANFNKVLQFRKERNEMDQTPCRHSARAVRKHILHVPFPFHVEC